MISFGWWQCGEGMTIDEDKKPYERAGRKKVDSSAETAIAWLQSLWLVVATVVRNVLCVGEHTKKRENRAGKTRVPAVSHGQIRHRMCLMKRHDRSLSCVSWTHQHEVSKIQDHVDRPSGLKICNTTWTKRYATWTKRYAQDMQDWGWEGTSELKVKYTDSS